VILLYFLFFFLIFAISFAVFSFSCLTFCRAYGNIITAPWWKTSDSRERTMGSNPILSAILCEKVNSLSL